MQNIMELIKLLGGNNVPMGNPLDPNLAALSAPQAPRGIDPALMQTIAGLQEAPENAGAVGTVPAGIVAGDQWDPSTVLSTAMPSAPAAPAPRKRGGILGALESVFMPEPDSRWAAALRGGLFDAKANQRLYKQNETDIEQKQQVNQLEYGMKLAELMKKLRLGDVSILGNNAIRTRPDGSIEWLTPPPTPDGKMQLLQQWRDEQDPTAKDLIYRMLLASNNPDVIQLKGSVAGDTAERRAAAVARHRPPPKASGGGSGRVAIPANAVVLGR